MTTIDNIRNDILNNNYDDYKKKIIKIKENNSKLNLSDKNINKLAENAKKMSYVINIINHSVNAKCINQKGFLKKITNEINKTTKLNFSTLDTYKIMNEAIKTKNEHKKLINKKEFKNTVIQMNGGFVSGYFGWDEETGFGTKALDILSLMLDLAGIVPGAGIAIDGINILINLIRGKWVMAGIGLVSILPIIGTVGPALKIGYQMISQPENEEESEEESSDEDE